MSFSDTSLTKCSRPWQEVWIYSRYCRSPSPSDVLDFFLHQHNKLQTETTAEICSYKFQSDLRVLK